MSKIVFQLALMPAKHGNITLLYTEYDTTKLIKTGSICPYFTYNMVSGAFQI